MLIADVLSSYRAELISLCDKNMKSLTVIWMLILACLPSAPAEEEKDPFAADKEEVRPERIILKLPSGVTHKKIDETRHQYTVSDIYMGEASKEEDPEEASSLMSFAIPDVLDLDLDFKAMKATFTTSRKLTLSELAYAIDDMAKFGGGTFPYWVELEARDLQPTKEFAHISYKVESTAEKPSVALAWFWMPDDEVFQIPLSLGGSRVGSLLVVPTTEYCMCHSRYSLRVLDPEGKLIWKEEGTAYAGVKIALSNSDADNYGMHNIWLTRIDHDPSESKAFLISGHFLREK